MAKRKRKNRGDGASGAAPRENAPLDGSSGVAREPAAKPLTVAKGLSAVLLMIGLVMLVLGGGVLTGKITQGWGFPMSAVPNWGKPWGAVLMLAGAAYVICPILLFLRPGKGAVVMMIVCGLSVLVGTPLITTTTEIFYNLIAQHDCQADWTICRPDWIDSIWGYFMIVNIGVLIAIYKALDPKSDRQKSAAPQRT